MKVKDGFVVCTVAGKTFAVASGELSKRFNGMISLNGTGELLFKMLQQGTNEDEMVDAILKEYDISPEQAKKDVAAFLAGLDKAGFLEK